MQRKAIPGYCVVDPPQPFYLLFDKALREVLEKIDCEAARFRCRLLRLGPGLIIAAHKVYFSWSERQRLRFKSSSRNSGKTGGKSPNGNLPAQIEINNFNRMSKASILQA